MSRIVPLLLVCLYLLTLANIGATSENENGATLDTFIDPPALGETDEHEQPATSPEVQIETIKEADICTRRAAARKTISVHYVGRLLSGDQFDSSRDRNQPFNVTLGLGHVIAGWEKGLNGMCVGEIRRLTIPPELAYGNNSFGIIGPNSTLIFEVELLSVEEPSGESLNEVDQQILDFFTPMDYDQDKVVNRDEIERYLREVAKVNSKKQIAIEVKEMMDFTDLNKDGVISLDEHMTAYRSAENQPEDEHDKDEEDEEEHNDDEDDYDDSENEHDEL